jgi:hypothetical protein
MKINKIWFITDDQLTAFQNLQNWSENKYGKIISIHEKISNQGNISYFVWYWE